MKESKPSQDATTITHKSPFAMIPVKDLLWAVEQPPAVKDLFLVSWAADPYGNRWTTIHTNMGRSTFFTAKKALSEAKLFEYRHIQSTSNGKKKTIWEVRNLHAVRNPTAKLSIVPEPESNNLDGVSELANFKSKKTNSESLKMDSESKNLDCTQSETTSEQGFQHPFNININSSININNPPTPQGAFSEGGGIFNFFEERLKQNGIYKQKWSELLKQPVPNPEFLPIQRALSNTTPEKAERAFQDFLTKCRTNEPMREPYKLLAWLLSR